MWPIAKGNGGNRCSQHQTTAKHEFSTSRLFQRHQTAKQKTRHLSVIFKNIRNILWSISHNSIAVWCSDALAVAHQQLPSTLLAMKKFTSQFLTMSSPVQAAGVPAMPWGQLLSLAAWDPQQALGATESWGPQRPDTSNIKKKKKDERLGALNGNWVQRISLDCQVILITSMVVFGSFTMFYSYLNAANILIGCYNWRAVWHI